MFTHVTDIELNPGEIIFGGDTENGGTTGSTENGGTEDGETESDYSEEVQMFLSYVRIASVASNNALIAVVTYAAETYNNLSAEERALEIVTEYNRAYALIYKELIETNTLSAETREEAIAILDAADEAYGA